MIPGWDILFIGMNPYNSFLREGFRTRSGHILQGILSLKERGRVYYVFPEGDKSPPFMNKGGGLFLVNLSILSLSQLIAREGLRKVIFWLYHPLFIHAIPYQKGIIIFDGVDNWLEHPQFVTSRDELQTAYQKIRERAHIIFTVSKELASFFNQEKKKAFQVKNAAPKSFLKSKKTPLKEMEGLPTPVIGYVGVIESRFDLKLIKRLASSLDRGTILLVGPVWEGGESLANDERITLFGFRPYHQIPSIIQSFQVGLIPHKVNSLTSSMDPLKIYEYLALGCPVVSTPVAGTKEFALVITIADSHHSFVEGVRNLLKNPGPSSLRKKMVAGHTWEKRLKKMKKILTRYLETGF